MGKYTHYGLLALAVFLAGGYAYERDWFGTAVMAVAACISIDNIIMQRKNQAVNEPKRESDVAHKGGGK